MKATGKLIVFTIGGMALASVLGVGIGSAVAQAPALSAPAGVTTDKEVSTVPMPTPTYAKNAAGQTYGSAALPDSPADEPDLIQAVTVDGQQGYVKKTDLYAADGTTAAQSFKSPKEALAWQKTEGLKDHVIPVYAVDGVTQVGEFTVVGGASYQIGGSLKCCRSLGALDEKPGDSGIAGP